jgi:hypothetical protein
LKLTNPHQAGVHQTVCRIGVLLEEAVVRFCWAVLHGVVAEYSPFQAAQVLPVHLHCRYMAEKALSDADDLLSVVLSLCFFAVAREEEVSESAVPQSVPRRF